MKKSLLDKCISTYSEFANKKDEIYRNLEKWSGMVYDEEHQINQSRNFKCERFLSEEDFVDLLRTVLDLEDEGVERIYESYEKNILRGEKMSGDSLFLGVARKKNSILRDIKGQNEIDENELNEMTRLGINGNYPFEGFEGVLCSSRSVWVTWDEDNADPFNFLDSVPKSNQKIMLHDTLALADWVLENDMMLIYLDSNMGDLHKPTICDAGNNTLFLANLNDDFGRTFPLSTRKKCNDLELVASNHKGRPEALISGFSITYSKVKKIKEI